VDLFCTFDTALWAGDRPFLRRPNGWTLTQRRYGHRLCPCTEWSSSGRWQRTLGCLEGHCTHYFFYWPVSLVDYRNCSLKNATNCTALFAAFRLPADTLSDTAVYNNQHKECIGQCLKAPGRWSFQNCKTDYMKVAPAFFTPRRHAWYSFQLRVRPRAIVRPERWNQRKIPGNPMTPRHSVAQFLNQLRHRIPHEECIQKYIAVVYQNDTELCMACICTFFFCKNCCRTVHCRCLVSVCL
jgi:hypothetical protein